MTGIAAGQVPSASVQRSMRLSVIEGLAFALMVGLGEIYFLADAIRLSATRLEQGLVVTLPLFVGSAGPLLALRLLALLPQRKPLVVGAALLQALALLAVGIMDALGVSSPATLIACACAYHVFGQAVGTAWASWFGDLVPGTVRGNYFARRNRGIYVMTCVGLFSGGALLQAVEPASATSAAGSGGGGFALIFALAAAARLASVALHAITPEPTYHRPSTRTRVLRFFATARGSQAWRLLKSLAALQFVVYIASPYFTPYMLGDLHFSYLEYTLATLVVILVKVLLLPVQGGLIDQAGARPVFLLSTLLAALVPLPWLWARGLGWVLVAQGLSGFAWAGFELSVFCLLIESSYRGVRSYIFAMQSVFNGTAQLLGSLTGALLVATLTADLRVLFAVSLVGRLLIALWLPKRIPLGTGKPYFRRRDVLFRVIGMRPSGGLVLRPLPYSAEHAEGSEEG
jgi:MFS family permease